MIFSYNTYINKAPISWQLEESHTKENEIPWTLLVRSYQDSQEICEDFDFDETKDLGGYEIQVGVLSSHIKKSSATNLESITGPKRIIARPVFRALNSTINIFVKKSVIDLDNMTDSGDTDIMFWNSWPQERDIMNPTTYLHRCFEMAFVTQHRGTLSQNEKLFRVSDLCSRYAVIIICFITFVFFKLFLRQSVTSAILTIVRLICSAAVSNLPNTATTRIYLSGLFIFFVTLQGIHQGKLSSLLTKPVAVPNVETFVDLENFKYKIYSNVEIINYITK